MRNWFRCFWNLPLVSIIFVLSNVVVYYWDPIQGYRFLLGGSLKVYDVLVKGEEWRLATAMFLHADLNHLFNNMIIVLFMGNMLERAVGHFSFGSIYLLSGIFGNVCSLFYKLAAGVASPSIGASGAVFGMDGLLLALVLWNARRMPVITPIRALFAVLLSLYNGFVSSNIDNAAHVGGLVAGFVLGCLFCIVQNIKYTLKEKRETK